MSASDQERWSPPALEHVVNALNYFGQRRPKQVVLTLVLKLGGNSRSKEQAILEAQAHATNMTAALLKLLQENPTEFRNNRAFAHVQQMLAKTQGASGTQVRALGDILSAHYSAVLSTKDYPIPASLRQGVFRNCALMLLTWCRRIGNTTALKDGDASEGANVSSADEQEGDINIPDLKHMFDVWVQQSEAYEAAQSFEMPFGRNRGKQLGELGNRDLRWLIERLPADDVVSTSLQAVNTLLHPDPDNSLAALRAKRVPHPWRRTPRQHRALQQRRFDQRRRESYGPQMRLGRLSQAELVGLQNELRELQQFAPQIDALRAAAHTMLYHRPPHFPVVQAVPVNESERQEQYAEFRSALDTFYDPFPAKVRRGTESRVKPMRLKEVEDQRRNRLLLAAGAIDTTKLQPLSFTRTIRPSNVDTFALLYDRVTGEYALAVVIHGEHATATFTPKTSPNLYYVNYPETPFVPPKKTSCLVFSVSFGREYHDSTYLQAILNKQRDKQTQLYQQRSADDPRTSIAEFLPDGALRSAKLLTQRNAADHIEMFVHLPIDVEPRPCNPNSPTKVIGFHEHDDGYSYALMTLKGEVLMVGDLRIPAHVSHIKSRQGYSVNYAFEVVVAMVKLATTYNACIGLEKANWKRRVSSSRAVNRRRFGYPRQKIAFILGYKTLLAGLLRPQLVIGVSPTRACGSCGFKLLAGTNGVRYRSTTACYSCGFEILERSDSNADMVCCTGCGHTWNALEEQFRCSRCSAQGLARYNVAIVVAQYTLSQLVLQHQRLRPSKKAQQLA